MGFKERVQDAATKAIRNSDVAQPDALGSGTDGLQSGDVSGALGAAEASVLRAQENQAAAEGNLAELAKERLGDPTATMQNGTATATSPDSLGSDVVSITEDDVADAARDVRNSEGGQFVEGSTAGAGSGGANATATKTLTVEGSGPAAGYRIVTSGSVSKGQFAQGQDSASDGVASGRVTHGKDTFQITGDVSSVSAPNSVDVLVDGEQVGGAMSASDVVPGWVPSDAPDTDDMDFSGVGARSLAIAAAAVVAVGAVVAGWFS